MKQKLAILLVLAALTVPCLAGAVTEEDFEVETTRNLMNLCTASTDHPHYVAAIHFCHGYLVGAYAYYEAVNAGPGGDRFVCFSKPEPSRNQAIEMFIEWAKAHPQYMNEKAVETQFRFLMEKWPCKE
jgi:hypothetical protein